jgi:hypothetical protein
MFSSSSWVPAVRRSDATMTVPAAPANINGAQALRVLATKATPSPI